MENLKVFIGMGLSGVAVAGGFTALWTGDWRFLLLPLAVYLIVRKS